MALLKSLPENPTLPDLRNQYSDLLDLLQPYAERLMRGKSPLTPGERELIAAYVSGLNSCRFCFGAHSLVAHGFGIEPSVFSDLMTDLDRAPVDARLKPILRYVQKLTQTPARMTSADAAAVYSADWSDEALFHAVAICAYFNNMNRLIEGTGIVGTPEAYASSARRLIDRGYSGAFQPRSAQSSDQRT